MADEKCPETAGVFQEDNGSNSLTRVMSFMCLIAALLSGGLIIWKGSQGGDGLYIFTILMVAAFAPKVIQKFAESKVVQDKIEVAK
jgi:hypothetical protein